MKKVFCFKNIIGFLAFAMLVFCTLKIQHMDERIGLIARPGKKFTINQILNKFPHNPEWEVKSPPEMIEFVNMITQQPFYYLGKGFQATAFVSQDGDYVIKFFHQTRLRPKSFSEDPFRYLFNKEFRQEMEDRQAHREEIFTSSKMGYEQFPEESGILYVHLNRTDNLIKGIKLIDNSGQFHRFRGDDASFIIQKRAQYVLPTIKAFMEQGKVAEAEQSINHIFELLLSLARKGFVDGDVALMRNNNIGLVKDHAIYIDTGHITYHPNLNVTERMRFEFDVRLAPLHDWLKIRYPELAEYFVKRKIEIMESLPPTGQEPQNSYNGKERRAESKRQEMLSLAKE